MSQEDLRKEGNIPPVSDDCEDDAKSKSSDDQTEPEGAVGGSYVGSEVPPDHDKPLEGATGGEMDDGNVEEKQHPFLTNEGRDDQFLFRRFFGDKYEQADMSNLERLQREARRRTVEYSNPSIGSAETALVGDVYAGNFSRRQSFDSGRGISPASSFPSSSSGPPTAASGNVKESEQPDREPFEGCRQSHDLEPLPRGKQERQRRFGIIHQEATRSKSVPLGQLPDTDKSQKRKVSKDLSVCSEPLPGRKVSKDSSVSSFEGMSYQEEVINYPRSVESDSCVPKPDLKEGETDESDSCVPMQDLKEEAATESDSCVPMPDLKEGAAAESLEGGLDALPISSGIPSEIKADVVDQAQETKGEAE